MIFPGPVAIFPELYVQHPVLAVFDAPMLAYTLGKPFQVSERVEIIPNLYGGFIANDPRLFDSADSR